MARLKKQGAASSTTPGWPPPVVDRRSALEPSLQQERMWFFYAFDSSNPSSNVPVGWRLDGPVDVDALGRAFQELARRHEALRTTYVDDEQGLHARVHDEVAPILSVAPTTENELHELVARETARPFDLRRDPPIRARLFVLPNDEHVLIVTTHHIATDGWSLGVLGNDLGELYRADVAGDASKLAALPFQYADFAAWQRRWLQTNPEAKKQLAYWRDKLGGAPAKLELRKDHTPASSETGRFEYLSFVFDEETTARARALASAERGSSFMLFVAAFNAVLSRHSGQDDIVVGSLLAGRTRPELEGMIGVFVNAVALRTKVDEKATFRALLRDVKQTTLDAYSHQDVPFERVLEELQVPRIVGQRPVFQVMLAFQNAPMTSGLAFEGVTVRREDVPRFDAGAELMMRVFERDGRFQGTLDYDASLYDRSTIERFAEHFRTLFEAAVAVPDTRVGALPLLSAAEERAVVVDWNATARDLNEPRRVHEIFEAQAQATPDAIALELGDERVTYRELDERANRLAHRLIALGCGPGRFVALCMDRCLEMVVSLYAILKTGAAYAPLDPSHPVDRLKFLVTDLGSPVVLVTAATAARVAGTSATVLDAQAPLPEGTPSSRPDVVHRDDHAAYVIYTSGSTGTPKGVVNVHSGLRNRILWMQGEYGLTAEDAVLQKTPYTFDVSVWEFFWPLMFGARLVVAAPDGHKDPAYLVETIRRHRITTAHFVPSMLALFLEHPAVPTCESLRRVILSGEALPRALQDRFFERLPCELHNLYGPTEASIDVSYWACQRDGRANVPIGRPIWNTQLYVIDKAGRPCPIGVPGELCIAGVGLARGYWNRPELTADRFVPDPFSATPGARMYRTGDLACWLPDGVIEYLGRIDHQIKLRGLRIELGEIESVLAGLEGVRAATVVVREDSAGDQRLVAYVEPVGLDVQVLKDALRATLPEYMVPNAFVTLDAMPLTTSGKVDRKALPAPELKGVATEFVAARNDTERDLVAIFERVLGITNVGVNDDFFALGGHSLLAMRVVARIRTVLGVELPVRAVFDAATVALLASRVAAQSGGPSLTAVTIPRVDRTKPAPVSFAQSRLWFLDQYERGAATYNVPFTMRLEGSVDADILERVFQELVRRHESLRTRYVAFDGEPRQIIEPSPKVALDRFTASSEEAARAILTREVLAPFDLASGPVARMALIRVRADLHLAVLCIHHIATDGWSFGILVNELSTLYKAFHEGKPSPLPPLDIDYVDFASWQRTWLTGPTLERELAFWKKALAGAPSALELPTDFPRPAIRSNAGASARFQLPLELSEGLRALCRRTGSTPFMIFLAAYQSVLARWSGQRDIVVGTPIANRSAEALESVVGLFVNTLPMRTTFDHSTTFSELIGRVKDSALAAYAHEHLPFEKLVEELKVVRDLSRTPVFQVFFAMQNMALGRVVLPDVEVRDESAGVSVAKLDLWLTIVEDGESFHGSLSYDVALFEAATAERFVEHFTTLLAGALKRPDARIDELPLLSESEKRRLLVEWNATHADANDTCVHERFSARARQAPSAIAVEDETKQYSYAELDDRAERVAGWLAARGVKRHERVAVCVERSADMVAAVLGVLKAGAAYVPIDPLFPEDRRDFMRTDARCVAELTDESLAEALRAPRPAPGSLARASAGDLAYVLYTSGSTGRPKGVMVEHRNLANFLRSMERVPGMSAEDTLVAVTTLSFDIAGLELYLPLVCGARLVVAKRDTVTDPRALAALLEKTRATVLQATPATWRMLLANKWQPAASLKMLCGGEAITPDLVAALTAGGGALWNMYGPTETTIWSTCIRLDAESAVSIGRPIENTQIYVLDHFRQPTPVGVPGELFIAGDGVARGYLGRPELTAERFLPDPFSRTPGARMYATGDLARWRRDGTLEYLSRLDHQVKVRGYRIELGEIESVLSAHPAVKQAVVAVHGASEDKRIVAYIIADPAGEAGDLEPSRLQAALKKRLPDYMVPSAFVVLDELPLTPNGKVDRKALPAPDFGASAAEYVAPRNATDETLTAIWQELLRLDRIGIHDDFFALGGHSLLATRSATRIHELLGVTLPVRVMFEAPTIAQLTDHIERVATAPAGPRLERVRERTRAPLSHNQELWWARHTEYPESPRFNYVEAYRIEGDLDVSIFAQCIDEEFRRHDALRTTMELVDGVPMQVIHEPRAGVLEYIDLRGADDGAFKKIVREQREHRHSAGAIDAPRALLVRVGEQRHMLLIGIHRITIDPLLCGSLVTEVVAMYDASLAGLPSPLVDPAFQNVDYADWQRRLLQTPLLQQRAESARRHLLDAVPLALPYDHPSPATITTGVRPTPLNLDDSFWSAVQQLARIESTTQFTVLAAILKSFLAQLTQQSNVFIVAPNELARGQDTALSTTFGCFSNYFLLRTDLSGSATLRDVIRKEHAVVLAAYANLDVPSVMLVDPRDEAAHWRVALNYVPDLPAWGIRSSSALQIRNVNVGPPHRMVDFGWAIFGKSGGLALSADKFDAGTASRIGHDFARFIDRVLAAPDTPVSELYGRGSSDGQTSIVPPRLQST